MSLSTKYGTVFVEGQLQLENSKKIIVTLYNEQINIISDKNLNDALFVMQDVDVKSSQSNLMLYGYRCLRILLHKNYHYSLSDHIIKEICSFKYGQIDFSIHNTKKWFKKEQFVTFSKDFLIMKKMESQKIFIPKTKTIIMRYPDEE